MSYIDIVDVEHGLFDAAALRDKGKELQAGYAGATPFPHVVIDEFLPPPMLDLCLAQFPKTPDILSQSFDREQERFKTSYHPDFMAPSLRSFFYSLNSRPFIEFVENATGIRGLIPDPHFAGGGFHEITQGGHLDIHIDFNYHRRMGLERRVNVLIYLNRDWKLDYGGGLEFWDADMKTKVKAIEPEFGRCVIFSTRGTSYHGNPEPVNHPLSTPRRSIALYYYTATWDEAQVKSTTQFRARPGTDDKADWRIQSIRAVNEFLPPVIARPIVRRLKAPLSPATK